MTLINLPHFSFTVRHYTLVKEVRLHSERGKATVTRVVGIVAAMPCRDTEVTVPVTLWVRVSCVRSLALIWWNIVWRPSPGGVGRDGTYTRGRGDRARRCLRPSLWGVGRGGTYA